MISAEERYQKKTTNVLGSEMAYVDEGEGDPIVFLHGNPTSSYLWRNVMPHLEGQGRLIAPDLIGMGDSAKLANSGPDSYTFVQHRDFLDALLKDLGVTENAVFVVHDWGSVLGFDWARRNESAVQGIAYMEAITRTLSWSAWPEQSRQLFQGFRSPAGDKLVLENNIFVEKVLPGSVIREMTDEEMSVYRRPYTDAGESRRPTLTWPRQIPIDGEPADVTEIVANYQAWLPTSDIPKLFVNAEPGAIVQGPVRDFCRTFANQREVTVKGVHFIQEDSPDEIGQAVSAFVKELRG